MAANKDSGRVLDPQDAGLLLKMRAALVNECRCARVYLPA